ncbi:MAG: dockerin type I repeat-containing protein [bacterium]
MAAVPESPAWVRCVGNYTTCADFCGSRGQACSNNCTGFGGCTGTTNGYNQAEAWAMNGSLCWNQGACTKTIKSPQDGYNAQFPHLCHEWFNAACCCGTAPPNLCTARPQGDANCDGVVNRTDFDIFAGFVRGQGYANLTYSADFNKDGKVNMVDYEIWRNTVYQ